MTPPSILEQEGEDLPDWIRAEPAFAKKTFESFLNSRVVFYPGSGSDGHALRLFGSTHNAHCFAHADYGAQGYGRNPKGYRAVIREELSAPKLVRMLRLDETHRFSELSARSCFRREHDFRGALWAIFKRMKSYDDSHGAEYLALLHVRAEAVWTFWNLWARRRSPPHAIVLQDHGLGGNWAAFGGADAPLYKLASECEACPRWLLVGENTKAWPGYRKASGPDRPAGMHGHQRSLYQRPR